MDKAEYMLKHYKELKNELEVVRYCLENFEPVNEDAAISSMVFQKSNEPRVSTLPSKGRAENLALNFRDVIKRENEERLLDLSQRYYRLTIDIDAFEKALHFLDDSLTDFCKDLMNPINNWDYLCQKYHVSRGTIRNWRRKILEHIRKFYLQIGHPLEVSDKK